MIAQLSSLDGKQPSRDVPRRGSGRVWPVIIISFMTMNATIVAITVYLAVSDRSVATEPDYYAKAIGFGSTIRQREASNRLGWEADPLLRATIDGRSVELVIFLRDREGRPINDAAVSAVAFANVRAGERQAIVLKSVDPDTGGYSALIRIDRSGVWNIRMTATRGEDTFLRDTDLLVPDILAK